MILLGVSQAIPTKTILDIPRERYGRELDEPDPGGGGAHVKKKEIATGIIAYALQP